MFEEELDLGYPKRSSITPVLLLDHKLTKTSDNGVEISVHQENIHLLFLGACIDLLATSSKTPLEWFYFQKDRSFWSQVHALMEKLKSEIPEPQSEMELQDERVSAEFLLTKWKNLCNRPNFTKDSRLIFVYDECRSLVEKDIFLHARRAFRALPRTESVSSPFVILTDTFSRISNFSPMNLQYMLLLRSV